VKGSIYLINPPPKGVFRDGYCSGRLKYGVSWQPLEFIVQAGILSKRFDIKVLDYVANKRLPEIHRLPKPLGAIILTGEVCWKEDVEFTNNFKSAFSETKVLVSGDVPQFQQQEAFSRLPKIDGILSDFGTHDTLKLFANEPGPYSGIKLRDSDPAQDNATAEFKHPPPPAWLMRAGDYRFPLLHPKGFYSVLSSIYCPFGCTFCNTGLLKSKLRPADDFLADFNSGIASGFRNFYVRDATFGTSKPHRTAILEEMARHRITFNCFTRTDIWDREGLELLARAGCALVQFGIESFSPEVQEKFNKRIDLDWAAEVIKRCHKLGMLVSVHIIATSADEPFLKSPKRYFRAIKPDFLSMRPLELRPGLEGSSLPFPKDKDKNAIERRIKKITTAHYLSPSPLIRVLTWKLKKLLKS